MPSGLEKWLNARPADGGAAHALTVGEVVGEWRVRAFVGAGRTSEVYRVTDVAGGAEGALKLLVDGSAPVRQRFVREQEPLRRLSSRFQPRYFGGGEVSGRPYYVMEYLQPLLLPLRRREVGRTILGVARAVEALHGAGYVHRDLKPDNVLLRRNGEPVLIDFGLVKRCGAGDGCALPASGVSLVDGRPVGVGTLGFAAPEQLLKGESSVRSDVFALGKVLQALFDGRPPARWRTIIRRATMESPEDRYPSVADFIRAVRRRNLGRVLAAVAALAVAAPGAWFLCASSPENPPQDAEDIRQRRLDESEESRFARVSALAHGGDIAAQTLLAEAYFHGRGTATNRAEAVRWYRLAAAAGNADAQASLGLCLLRGWGCPRDASSAVGWYRRAAEQGCLPAMNDLAFCLMNGIGVDRDDDAGFDWAMKAAERGFAPAQVMVAECYLDGRGVEADHDRADVWLHRAVRQGNARARLLLRTR